MITALQAVVSERSARQRDYAWLYERIDGLDGGAVNMEIHPEPNDWNLIQSEMNAYHDARGTVENPYEWNPNLWCLDLREQLTGAYDCFRWNNNWSVQYGTTLITPQHVVCCAHAGTPHIGTDYRWIDKDGIAHTNRVIAGVYGFNKVNGVLVHLHGPANEITDISIGLLETPMPSSIRPFRIAPAHSQWMTFARSQMYREGQDNSPAHPLYTQETWPYTHHPRRNQAMFWLSGASYLIRSENRDNWKYGAWSGDSGTPNFTYRDGEVLMAGMTGSNSFVNKPSQYGYFSVATWTDYINRMIAAVNAKAIAEELVESVDPEFVAQEATELRLT